MYRWSRWDPALEGSVSIAQEDAESMLIRCGQIKLAVVIEVPSKQDTMLNALIEIPSQRESAIAGSQTHTDRGNAVQLDLSGEILFSIAIKVADGDRKERAIRVVHRKGAVAIAEQNLP
jgi:hypothetical protein